MTGKLPYREGDWFAVPLRDGGGYGVGLVARMDGRGGAVGYFFGPRREGVPSLQELEHLTPEQAILIDKFGDLRLIRSQWPILGRQDNWDRDRWPMPAFCRVEQPFTDRAWRVEYNDADLMHPVKESLIRSEDCALLPRDGLSGAGAVEKLLTQLLI